MLQRVRWGKEKGAVTLAGLKKFEQVNFTDITGVLEEKGFMEIYKRNTGENSLPPSYFKDPWGVHGVRHARRVLLLNLVLSYFNNLAEREIDLLVMASLYHDIGRVHNGKCQIHGKQSYLKMNDFGLIKVRSGENQGILKFIVENHCVNDKIALSEIKNYQVGDQDRAVKLFNIFKDSDGLDRVRLGDFNTRYLRNPFSPGLVTLANYLLEVFK